MKVGDLVKVVWTEGSPLVDVSIGVVAKIRQPKGRFTGDRQRVEIFCNGKPTWLERGDLEVIA